MQIKKIKCSDFKGQNEMQVAYWKQTFFFLALQFFFKSI